MIKATRCFTLTRSRIAPNIRIPGLFCSFFAKNPSMHLQAYNRLQPAAGFCLFIISDRFSRSSLCGGHFLSLHSFEMQCRKKSDMLYLICESPEKIWRTKDMISRKPDQQGIFSRFS